MGERAIVAGPDPDGLGDALADEGLRVSRIDGTVSATTLEEAGIGDAELFVLTEMDEATGVSVAKEQNPDVRAVVYSPESLPDFAAAQTDIAIDPALLAVEVVAEELAN